MTKEIFKVKGGGGLIIEFDPHSYQDLVDMPDPINTSFGIRIFNYTMNTLYFTALGSGDGAAWSWGAVQQLGGIASGANAYFYLSNLGSRTKPASAVDDSIQIMVRAYSDSGYTIEVGSGYPILITYHWIKSDTLTLLDLDNFDAGTLENWTATVEDGGDTMTFVIDTAYVLSSPNSARLQRWDAGYLGSKVMRTRISKSFTIPACTKAYFIANAKTWLQLYSFNSTYSLGWTIFDIYRDTTALSELRGWIGGLPWATYSTGYKNYYSNWLREIALLPVNQTIEIRIIIQASLVYSPTSGDAQVRTYFDDLKVVYEP